MIPIELILIYETTPCVLNYLLNVRVCIICVCVCVCVWLVMISMVELPLIIISFSALLSVSSHDLLVVCYHMQESRTRFYDLFPS